MSGETVIHSCGEELSVSERLREVDKTWNVGPISEVILEILQENPGMTLLDIEDHFRTLDSNTFLVAWPREQIPSFQLGKKVVPRNINGEAMPYGLWLSINGRDDMLQQLHEFGLTIEQNREALLQTGFNTLEG